MNKFPLLVCFYLGYTVCAHALSAKFSPNLPACTALLPAGSEIRNPPFLRSVGGKLSVEMVARNQKDKHGNERYCFVSADGKSLPTLELNRGDLLEVSVINGLTAFHEKGLAKSAPMPYGFAGACGPASGLAYNQYATNLHFHGLNLCLRLRTALQPSKPPSD
jgi:hypothetical protein